MHALFYDASGIPRDLSQWFFNIEGVYWSGREYTDTSEGDSAWVYYFDSGSQSWAYKTGYTFAWAVHDGNISAVPLPAAAWLFGSGMLGLIGIAGRRRQA